jgi:hypothetical protein
MAWIETFPRERAAGLLKKLCDAAIHDVVEATALFSYYDRLADGLGVDPEPEWES